MKLSLGKKGLSGEKVVLIMGSHYLTLFLIGNQIIFLSSCLFPMMVAGE